MSVEREALLSGVQRWLAAEREWASKVREAEAEADDLSRSMGGDVLDAPERATELATKLAAARASREVAEASRLAVAPRLVAARIAVLEHDAAAYEAEASAIRVELEAHQSKTTRLLAQLQRHEGEFVSVEQHISAIQDLVSSTDSLFLDSRYSVQKRSKSSMIIERLQRTDLRARVLRMLIAGDDPRPEVSAVASMVDGKVFGVPASEFWPPAVAGDAAIWTVGEAVTRRPDLVAVS